MMKLNEGWVPVALSSSIEAGTSAGAVVCGSEIVVWRDEGGEIHVWEDRCPHRGMRLSFGFVRGDHIACLYHGWQYDAAGQCRYIPAHPALEVPQAIKVPTYRAAERAGIVWATALETATDLPAGDVSEEMAPVRSVYIDRALGDVEAACAAIGRRPAGPALGRLRHGADDLLLAFQEIGPGRSAVHIVATAADASARKAHARWAESLRRGLEGGEPLSPAERADVA